MADDTPATNDLPDFIKKRNDPDPYNSLTPALFENITQDRATQTVVHRVLRRSTPELSLGVTETRTGTITALFKNRTQDWVKYLSGPTVFTLRCYSDTSLDNMHFVITGPLIVDLDDSTRRDWHVSFDYAEVL